jgi:Bacterial extracellular solute-binding protein
MNSAWSLQKTQILSRNSSAINKPLIAALICALPFASNAADAADIKILCASGMREIVSELQPRLGQVGGQQVSISFGEAGDLRKRIQGGEIGDVVILPRIVLDQVARVAADMLGQVLADALHKPRFLATLVELGEREQAAVRANPASSGVICSKQQHALSVIRPPFRTCVEHAIRARTCFTLSQRVS